MLTDTFLKARDDASFVVLEGFHALKHAYRFGAELEKIVCADKELFAQMCTNHAPELTEVTIESVTEKEFTQLSPTPPETKIIGIAKRPEYDLEALLKDTSSPLIVIDKPSHPGNVGSCIRASAALGARGVITIGTLDPWRPQVIRGAQGLHFALPVIHLPDAANINTPMYVLDERGESLQEVSLPTDATLVFGSERRGVSDTIKQRAEKIIRIPMREKVSSLNLATSVGVALSLLR